MANIDQAAPKKNRSEQADIETAPPTFMERVIADWNARPKFWLGIVIVAGILILGGILAWSYLHTSSAQKEAENYDTLVEALREQDAEQMVTRLRELESTFTGTEQAPFYWLQLAMAARRAVGAVEEPQKKLDYYKTCLDACTTLETDFPDCPWSRLPWKSGPLMSATDPGKSGNHPSLVRRLSEHATEQIAWLGQHTGVDLKIEPDPDLVATLTLDVDGESHDLKIRFFSKEAPYAVDNFLKLAREGYFDGTHVYGLQQDDPNSDENHAVLLGSAFSKLVPDRTDLLAGEKDDVGYTLPVESSRLKAEKGRIAWEVRRENRATVGNDPVKLVIYPNDPIRPMGRLVFAEIEDSEEAMKALAALEAAKDGEGEEAVKKRLENLQDPFLQLLKPTATVKVTGVRVAGAPLHPPAVPLNVDLKMPEMPEPLKKAEDEKDGDEVPEDGGKKTDDPNK